MAHFDATLLAEENRQLRARVTADAQVVGELSRLLMTWSAELQWRTQLLAAAQQENAVLRGHLSMLETLHTGVPNVYTPVSVTPTLLASPPPTIRNPTNVPPGFQLTPRVEHP